jgi:flagellin-specific chaperone FliS
MIGSSQTWQAASAYRAVEGVGAAPEDFLKMGLDAARNLLLRAEAAIAEGDRVAKARTLSAAGSIVEFMLGLSGSAPGALSARLAGVYQYALGAILKANAGDDAEAAGAARVALEELAATWRAIFPDARGYERNDPHPALSGRREYV